MGGTFFLKRDLKAVTQSQPISYFPPYFLGSAFKLPFFFFLVSLSSSWLSYSLFYTPAHTENKIEREVPGIILESGLPSSKGAEAILSEVKPVFKIT